MATGVSMPRLGIEIRRRREALGLTIYAAAKRCRLSESHWKSVESGRPMTLATLLQVSGALEVDPGALLRAAGLSAGDGDALGELLAGLDDAERAYVAEVMPAIIQGLVRMRGYRRSRAHGEAPAMQESIAAYDRPFPAPDEEG